MNKIFLSLVFLLLGTFASLQAQTLDGNFSSIGKEAMTATIQVTAIAGQPFGTVAQNDGLSYGFMERVSLANEATALTGITLDKKTVSVETGNSTQLKATLLSEDTDYNQTVNWHSSDPSVATVSGGLVRALSSGSATITVTSACGLFADACMVTVQAGSTAIDRIETGDKVYPVVVRNEVFVDLQQPQSIYLINMAGEVCATLQGKAGLNVIRMQSYPAGIYLVRLSEQTVKIIKR